VKLDKLKKHITNVAVWSVVVLVYAMTIQTLVTMKVTGAVDWSWWWVLSPLWAPWIIVGVISLLVLIVVLLIGAWAASRGKEKRVEPEVEEIKIVGEVDDEVPETWN
jgi:uncharacterized membrane protein